MMAAEAFDDLPDAYDAMIDWPKRLANEEPFYRWLVEQVGARSLLDVACGTGRHAAMFHSWGLRVEGADISPAMIQRCKDRFGESDTLRWMVRGYEEPAGQPGRFDLAICTGNSLALATDTATVERAVGQMLAAVRPAGAIVVHVVNVWRLPEGPVTWQKCRRARLAGGDSLILKGLHRCGPRGYVDFLVVTLSGQEPVMQTESVPFLGLESAGLERMMRQAGARQVEVFGDYRRSAYDPQHSQDLIVVANK